MILLTAVATVLGMPVGHHSVPLVCLGCGGPNHYEAERCASCGEELPAFPPYLHSNHLCQLQLALAAYEEGGQPRERLVTAYSHFAELVMRADPPWTSDFHPARDSLLAALDLLDRWTEEGDDAALASVDELLTDFFRYACGSCATLVHELEQEPVRGPGSGALHDYVE